MARVLTLLGLLLLVEQVWADTLPRRVLLIHSFGRDFAPFHRMSESFRSELSRRCSQPLAFFDASLEMARFDGADRDEPLLEFLAAIFDDHSPDLIVPVGAPAAFFCRRHRAALFPHAPVLVLGADKRRLERIDDGPDWIEVSFDIDLTLFIDNILRLLPRTRHVHVVTGRAPLERFWEESMKEAWAPFASAVRFHWHDEGSFQETLDSLSGLPRNAAVFFSIYTQDARGIPYEQDKALLAVCEAAPVPVFGYAEAQLGLGIVGGPLVPFRETGTAGARVAARLLEGDSAADFRQAPRPLTTPIYDDRQLKRWRISPSRLPPDSWVRNREPSLWETHRRELLLAAALTLLQTGLIVLLLTTRHRAREAGARLNLAAQAAKVGLWVQDEDHPELEASENFRSLFGLSEKDRLRFADVLERIHPEDRANLRLAINRAAHEGESFTLEHRIVLPDGSTRWITSVGRTEGRKGGKPRRTRGASMDVTERKQFESVAAKQRDELAHLTRVVSLNVLSGSLAHELNQPLGIILSNAQAAQRMLARGNPDLEELREILDDIVDEDRRAGAVIARLRNLLQRGEIVRQSVDVNRTVEEILHLTRRDLTLREIAVKLDLDESSPKVLADHVQLQQVILNLVVNACQAMEATDPADRILTVKTKSTDESVEILVSDRGCGLPDDVEALFEPFHSTKTQGLGMGLAICRSIISSHEGELFGEPNKTGGATFRVRLPRHYESECA